MKGTFNSFTFIIFIVNFFGIFPVSIKKVAGYKLLCFQWKSVQVVHCLISGIGLGIFNVILSIRETLKNGIENGNIGSI